MDLALGRADLDFVIFFAEMISPLTFVLGFVPH